MSGTLGAEGSSNTGEVSALDALAFLNELSTLAEQGAEGLEETGLGVMQAFVDVLRLPENEYPDIATPRFDGFMSAVKKLMMAEGLVTAEKDIDNIADGVGIGYYIATAHLHKLVPPETQS